MRSWEYIFLFLVGYACVLAALHSTKCIISGLWLLLAFLVLGLTHPQFGREKLSREEH